jgi:YNFM family putative membrane transporter
MTRGSPAYRRMAIALLLAGLSIFALLYNVQPLLPLFARRFQVDAATASLAVSATTGTMALSLLPLAMLSDRVGRLNVMAASLFASAVLTALTAAAPNWTIFLVLRALTGLALAGAPSVAMAYVFEEVEDAAVGSAMGLYVGGSAVGGMAGRVGMTLLADAFGWRWAMAALGVASLAIAAAFQRLAPPAQAFVPVRRDPGARFAGLSRLFRDAALPLLFAEGFLLMGAFVTLYNYVGFRLQAPPYRLSQTMIGLIFVLYLLGSVSSARFGGFAGRVGPRAVFWAPIAALMAGIALTAAAPLALIILGVAVVTAAFFAAHATASAWVGQRASEGRAQAASVYLLFYYLGSSLAGSAGGLAWGAWGWPGVIGFDLVLTFVALAIALRLAVAGDAPPTTR